MKLTSTTKRRLILASGSPRRIELLKKFIPHIEIIIPKITEKIKPSEKPNHYVKRLSIEKASAVSVKIHKKLAKNQSALILAADTTVVLENGRILEKPSNRKHAFQMLSKLQGKTHRVLTGYCIVEIQHNCAPIIWTRVCTTLVTLSPLSENFINTYIDTNEPMDKAGAYAAQGFGLGFIDKVNGSYSNVVGLPVSEVLKDLATRFQFAPWEKGLPK